MWASFRRAKRIGQGKILTNSFTRTIAFTEVVSLFSSYFLGGGGDLYHEQYNEHGVKIENQCFP